MGQQISIDDLQRQMGEILQTFNHECNTLIDEAAKVTAAEGARLLKSYSPKRRGNYARTWTWRQTRRGTCYIYNNRNYRLTHLLENGHRTNYRTGRYGSRTETASVPHISLVETFVQEEFPRKFSDYIEYQR